MTALPELARYSRASFGAGGRFTRIGQGPVGGKAAGLVRLLGRLGAAFPDGRFGPFEVTVPSFTVVAADWFDAFLAENGLPGAPEGRRDDEIAMAFQRATLPVGLVGDLRALMEDVRAPLALRSSSLLEDALEHPFAGVYGTKMTPNDQLDADTRFTRMVEAIKFVWASTFFAAARAYRARVGAGESERMAVLVQEVVGRRHRTRHYPDVSGVARSLAFYRFGGTSPEEGVGQLALGLGRTIVQGEPAWTFCPARPKAMPPYGSTRRSPARDAGALLGGADGRAARIRPDPRDRVPRPRASRRRRGGRHARPHGLDARSALGAARAGPRTARGRASSRSPRSSSSTSCRSPRS